MARLKPKANIAQAKAACDVIFRQALDDSMARVENPTILLEKGSRGPLMMRHQMAQPFWMLLGAVGFVMLIACFNVAGMLLSRGETRRHEMAVRAALGARPSHLLRQSFLESLVLSGLVIIFGLLFSIVIRQGLAGFLMNAYGRHNYNLSIDITVLLYTIGLSLGTTLLFGLIPAWRISNVDPTSGMGSTRVLGGNRMRLGSTVVVIQMGLSLLLVVFAGLLIQSLVNLKLTNPGFDTEKLLVFFVDAHEAGYAEGSCADFYEHIQASVAALPGVEDTTFANDALLRGDWNRKGFTIRDQQRPPELEWTAPFLCVGKDFFKTLGIPFIQGRAFNNNDTKEASQVVVINECFVRTFFPGKNPIGQHLDDYQIVGVCRDTKYLSMRSKVHPIMYFPNRQSDMRGAFVMARTNLPPLSLSSTVRHIVSELDVTIPVKDITTQTLMINDSLSMERLAATLCLSLAGLGLLLAAIGLYGLMSYTVTRRTLEIGLRMALGAGPCDVARPILRQVVVLSLAGIAIGLPVTLVLTRIIKSIVYGVNHHDPVTLVIGVGILFVVTLLAAWIPTRRAIKIDPMEALRCE
jgi:predicted permease